MPTPLTDPTARTGGLFVVADDVYQKRRAAGYSDDEARRYPDTVHYHDTFYDNGTFYPNIRLLARGTGVSETSLRRYIHDGQSAATALARLRYRYPAPDPGSPIIARRIAQGFTPQEAETFPLGIQCKHPVRVFGVTFPSDNAYEHALIGTSRAFRKACRAARRMAQPTSHAYLFFDDDRWHARVPVQTEQET